MSFGTVGSNPKFKKTEKLKNAFRQKINAFIFKINSLWTSGMSYLFCGYCFEYVYIIHSIAKNHRVGNRYATSHRFLFIFIVGKRIINFRIDFCGYADDCFFTLFIIALQPLYRISRK
jgi:hypothetical protein